MKKKEFGATKNYYVNSEDIGSLGKVKGESLKIEERIFYLYLLAGQYYFMQGNYYQSLLQLKKVLLLIRRLAEFESYNKSDPYNIQLDEVTKKIAFEAFEMIDGRTIIQEDKKSMNGKVFLVWILL